MKIRLLTALFGCLLTLVLDAATPRMRGVDDNTPRRLPAGESLCLDCPSDGIDRQVFEFGVTPDPRKPYDWTVTLEGDGPAVSVRVHPGVGRTDFDNRESMAVTVTRPGHAPENIVIPREEGYEVGSNFLRVNVMPDGMEILAGASTLSLAARLPFCGYFRRACVTSANSATLRRSVVGYQPAPELRMTPYTTAEAVRATTQNSRYAIAGTWQQFDVEFDDEYAVPAGTYTLGILPEDDGRSFTVVYLGGMRTDAAKWRPGMVKGTLTPTSLPGVYDLVWLDADGNPLRRGENAYLENETLNILFPLDHLKLRFVRP